MVNFIIKIAIKRKKRLSPLSLFLFISTSIGTVFYFLPNLLPFLSPCERSLTSNADFSG